MQTQHGVTADEAILNAEREFRVRLNIDWGQNGSFNHELSEMGRFVSSASLDRALSGSVPAEVLLVDGSAAAELTVDLSGEYAGQSLANMFSPYNKRSPLYGTPMVGAELVYEIGVESTSGTYWYPQFVGKIRTITTDRGGNKISISALDRAEEMRRPIVFPSWALSDKQRVRRKVLVGQLTKSSWVIDHCLRMCDASPTPFRPAYTKEWTNSSTPHDGTMLWINATGSHLPTIGWIAGPYESLYPKVEGTSRKCYERRGWRHWRCHDWDPRPYNMCSQGTNSPADMYNYWVSDRDYIVPQAYHHIAFTAHLAGQEGTYWQTATTRKVFEVNIGARTAIRVLVHLGGIYTQTLSISRSGKISESSAKSSVAVPLPTDGSEYARVQVVWRFVGGTIQYRIQIGAATSGNQTIAGTGWASSSATDWRKGYATLYTGLGVSDLSYAIRNATDGSLTVSDVSGTPAKYAAVLDEGIQDFTYLPVRKGDDAWKIVTDCAAAEFGSVFWDETGIFRSWDYSRMTDLQDTVVRSFSLDDVSGLGLTNTLDSVRNSWTIEAGKATSIQGRVYDAKSPDEFYVEAGATVEFQVWSDAMISPDMSALRQYSAIDRELDNGGLSAWGEEVNHGFVATFLNGTITWTDDDGEAQQVERWEERPADVGKVKVQTGLDVSGNLTLTISNAATRDCRLATTTVKYEEVSETYEVVTDADETGATATESITETWMEEADDGAADPQGALRVGGAVIKKFDPAITKLEHDASIALYGERNLKFSGDWIQDGTDLTKIQTILMPRMLKPAPTTDAIRVAGDPRIQLGDTVEIRDLAGFGDNMKVQIYAIRRSFDTGSGLTDELTIEMIQPVPLTVDPTVPVETIVRTNLMPNPALRLNGTGWEGDSDDTEESETTGLPRRWAFLVHDSFEDVYTPDAAVVAGQTYRASAYLKAGYRSMTGKMHVDWMNSSFDDVGTQTATVPFSISKNGTVRVSTGPIVAPAGATLAELHFEDNTGDFYITAVLFERTSQLLDYFDGDTEGAVWNANGTSTWTQIVEPDEPVSETHPDSEYVPPAPDGSLNPPA